MDSVQSNQLFALQIATVVINNQVLEDDGFDKTKEHYIAYGLNAALFVRTFQ
eukprot:SAG31_NODE_4628_length_3085_cov_372.429002_5_plen_52_part_00